MSGTGKAGDTITVYDGSKTLGSVVIGADGKWSFKPTTDLSAGTHDIYVIETNLAGAVSPQSDHTAITVSTVLPAPTPVITQFIDAVGFVQGNIPSGGTSDDSRPTIKGTGHAGDTISLFDGTTAIGSTVVDSAGNWSVRLGDDLARGTHSIHANASSSTTSSSASSNTYVVLMTAPATVPVITQLIDAAGPVQGNVATGGTTDDKTPTLKGTGNPGDQVDIHDGSVTIGGTKVDASGNWSIKLPSLSDSVHTLTAWSFNGVNWSSSSVVYTVTVDTTTPAKPVITGLTDDAGAAIPAGGSTINAHPTVSGTAKAGDIVTLYDGATAIGSAKVGADGKWSIKPSKDLSVGSHDVYAIDTNLAGAVSPQSVHVAFTVTSSLTAPVILNVVDSVGPVQGTVAAGGVTDDPRPSISGTGIPGYTVYLYQNDLGCGEAKVGADGK
ncbi:hypothetical protein ASG35_30465 [Burkholderia sp. Leaf177]|nr:hypothetical protein ASG35_30465 [Burkholderia sp. Leaf177]